MSSDVNLFGQPLSSWGDHAYNWVVGNNRNQPLANLYPVLTGQRSFIGPQSYPYYYAKRWLIGKGANFLKKRVGKYFKRKGARIKNAFRRRGRTRPFKRNWGRN